MYKYKIKTKSSLIVNNSLEGETIETKIERIISNKEPIKDGAPLIYTERANGIEAGYNIRTDRWEIAIDGMDSVTKSRQAKRENKGETQDNKVIDINKNNDGKISGAETTQGTDN